MNLTAINFSLVAFLFFASEVLASPSYYGIAKEVQGIAFIKSGDRTVELKEGMRIFDHSEIMTSAGSQVTLMDRYDHIFHLSNSAHIKVYNQIVTLKRGYVWFQSLRRSNESFALESANAQVIYQGGEGIFSFDDFNGRSQFLSIKGRFLFGNPQHEMHVEQLREGEFSFIDNNLREGKPRQATSIGYDSYQRVTSLFHGVSPLSGEIRFPEMGPDSPRESRPSRTIASIGMSSERVPDDSRQVKVDHDQLRKYYSKQLSKSDCPQESEKKTKRGPASVEKKQETTFRPNYSRKSGVPVRVYRLVNGEEKTAARSPSSKKQESRRPASLSHVQIEDPFEQGLNDQYQRQQRHSQEVRALIQDLKTYERDFKISY